jgi:hypothetical protein
MPKRRLQTDVAVPTTELRPAARVQDTFVSPGAAGSQAAQLAQALSSLSPRLAQLAGEIHSRQSKQDLTKGAEAARETVRQLDEDRQSYAEAVRSGKLPANMNPYMKQGYYEELGRVYGDRLHADLITHIQTDENLQNTIEMSDYRASVSKFEQEWMKANVPKELQNGAFHVGYGARRDAILANMEAGWASQTEKRFTQRSLGMFRDQSVQFIMEALDQDRSAADIGSFLKQMWDDKHALGWDGRMTGQTLVDAISDVAIARKDPELMDELLAAVPGAGGKSPKKTLARTSYAIETAEKTAEQIFSIKRREWSKQDREREAELKDLSSEAAARMEEAETKGLDPDDVPIDDLQLRAIGLGSVDVSNQLQVMKEAYGNREYEDDNNLVADFLERLHRGPGVLKQAALNVALKNKNLSLRTYNELSNALKQQEASAGKGEAFLENDPYHEYGEKTLRGYFGSNPDADTPEVAYRRQQSVRQFSQWYYEQFLAKNAPNAAMSGKERRDAIDAFVQDAARVWVPYEDGFSGTFRLSGADLDWKSRPVDTPDRIGPLLDELAEVTNRKKLPSPALTSLLRVYKVNPKNKQELLDFLATQRKLAASPPPTPKQKKTE